LLTNNETRNSFLLFTYYQRHRIDLSKTIFLNLKDTEIFDDENNNILSINNSDEKQKLLINELMNENKNLKK